jgi:hypothetical protein
MSDHLQDANALAYTGAGFLCGPRRATAKDLEIVGIFERWLAGDRTERDDKYLPVPPKPVVMDPDARAREDAWASANSPDSYCLCGHPWGIHDVDEYRGDGSEMCCVTGCTQIGCPGRRPREQWESSSEEGA